MIRRIRIRTGSANFYTHNTQSVLPKHARQTLPFQSVTFFLVVSPTSYADLHNTPSLWIGSEPVQLTANAHRCMVEDMGLARVIHEPFYCKRGYAAATGMLAAQSVNVLQRIRLPPSRLRLPLSRRVYAFSQRIVMNNLGWIIVVLTSLCPSNS